MINETCSVLDCPRNEVGKCELAKLSKEDPNFVLPERCTHKKFKERHQTP
jgi:hypothetical protein